MREPEIVKAYHTVEDYNKCINCSEISESSNKENDAMYMRSIVYVDDIVVDGDNVYVQTKPYNEATVDDPDRVVIRRLYEIPKEELLDLIFEHYVTNNKKEAMK